jgi:protein gp37
MNNTKIEWADATWNPITGCSKISEGCEHCYAERMVKRFPKIYSNGFKPTFHEKRLSDPLRWRKPRRVFVCSMGDLFHEDVPIEWVYRVFNVMKWCPQHTFLLLTKRPERAKALTEAMMHFYYSEEEDPLTTYFSHVWLGVTIESSEHTHRAVTLLQTNFAHRFVSLEPLLSSINIDPYVCNLSVDRGFIEWVIVGGETGPKAREMKPEWVSDIRDTCIEHEVPFFFKKWGGVRRSENERLLDGREWNEFPEAMK